MPPQESTSRLRLPRLEEAMRLRAEEQEAMRLRAKNQEATVLRAKERKAMSFLAKVDQGEMRLLAKEQEAIGLRAKEREVISRLAKEQEAMTLRAREQEAMIIQAREQMLRAEKQEETSLRAKKREVTRVRDEQRSQPAKRRRKKPTTTGDHTIPMRGYQGSSIDADVASQGSIPCPSCQRVIPASQFECVDPKCPYCLEELYDDLDSSLRTWMDEGDSEVDFDGLHQRLHREKSNKAALERAKAMPAAKWMASEFRRVGYLRQGFAARAISERFGEEFTYRNNQGVPAIAKSVLKIFRELTEHDAVWETFASRWRKRCADDDPTSRVAK